jgi:hypothetical protein
MTSQRWNDAPTNLQICAKLEEQAVAVRASTPAARIPETRSDICPNRAAFGCSLRVAVETEDFTAADNQAVHSRGENFTAAAKDFTAVLQMAIYIKSTTYESYPEDFTAPL